MKKFEGILICTDLDGTLLNSASQISKENLAAIEYFKKEGGLFTFFTGRMPFFVENIYSVVDPNAPFGCINGGGIYDHRRKEYLWTRGIDYDALELVAYIDRELPTMGIQVNTFDKIYFSKENAAMKRFREITGLPNLVKPYAQVEEPLAKIVFGDMDLDQIRRLDELLHSHPKAKNFDFIHSEDTLYEILPKNSGKASLLPRFEELLHISHNKLIAVGDYYNDLEMIRCAGVGVAVANAMPEVKAVADYITVSNDENAIAQIIQDIENGVLPI